MNREWKQKFTVGYLFSYRSSHSRWLIASLVWGPKTKINSPNNIGAIVISNATPVILDFRSVLHITSTRHILPQLRTSFQPLYNQHNNRTFSNNAFLPFPRGETCFLSFHYYFRITCDLLLCLLLESDSHGLLLHYLCNFQFSSLFLEFFLCLLFLQAF